MITFDYLLAPQGKFDEAGPLYERSLTIRVDALGPNHPDVAESLNNRAGLLKSQVRGVGWSRNVTRNGQVVGSRGMYSSFDV